MTEECSDGDHDGPYPIMGWTAETSLGDAIGSAIGAASVCWIDRSWTTTKLFDDQRAGAICHELEDFVVAWHLRQCEESQK